MNDETKTPQAPIDAGAEAAALQQAQSSSEAPLQATSIHPTIFCQIQRLEGDTVMDSYDFDSSKLPPQELLYPTMEATANVLLKEAPPVNGVQEQQLRVNFVTGTGPAVYASGAYRVAQLAGEQAFKLWKRLLMTAAQSFQPEGTLLKVVMLLLMLVVPLGGSTGCGEAMGLTKPSTKMSMGPHGSIFSWESEKDFEGHLKGLKYHPEDKSVEIESVDVTNSASSVITANIAQLQALGQNYLLLGQAWSTYTNSVSNLINGALQNAPGAIGALSGLRQFAPVGTLSTPFGSASIPADALKAIVEEVIKQQNVAKGGGGGNPPSPVY